MLFCTSMVQSSRNGLVGGRSLSSLKQMFHKDSTVSNGLLDETCIDQPALLAAVRPSIGSPVTIIGVALTFGASIPLLSAHEPVLAADGVDSFVISSSLPHTDEGSSSNASSSNIVAYYTVESGDSLWQIAQHHDANVKVLEITNGISADEVLRVGQVLKVPPTDISSTTASPDVSTATSGGVGGEFTPLSSANSSLTLESAEEFSNGWATLDPSLAETSSHVSQAETGSEDLSAEANFPTSGSKPSLATAQTLISFSYTGSMVSVTYPEQALTPTETSWVSASTQLPEITQKSSGEIPVLQSEADPSNNFQSAQASPEAEVNLAAADTYAVNREQRIRESLARIRDANTVSIDRGRLASKLALARQQLERSRTQESNRLAGLASAADPSRLATSSPSAAPAVSELKSPDARIDGWAVTDVADTSSTTPSLARSTSATASTVSMPISSINAGNQHLLAAAPLNPDIYRPLPTTPSGETVVPGMPMLPGAGEFLPQAPAESNGYVWPTRGTFTSGYGWRWGRMHRGIDIAGPVGTPVVAAASGVVVRSGWNSGGYGNVVDIRHRDGSMTRYAHNSRLLVREGQQVTQGQSIAQMGSTGYSTGPHLHFEIHLPGNGTVNPIAYLPGR